MQKQIEFLFYLKFAFHFIYFREESAFFCLNEVMRIDGAIFNAGKWNQIAEHEFIDNVQDLFFRHCCVNSH